jgi:hypothetical protein
MTFVSYPNIVATSPNGSRRIEIMGSPSEDFFRDRAHFTYRSYSENRCTWEWTPTEVEQGLDTLADFPHEAWISNDGWIVVRTHHWFGAGLLVLSPAGKVVLHRSFRRLSEEDEAGFLDSESPEFMGESSAGPFWARFSVAYFSERDGRPHWTIRTWWGRRIVIDLLNGEFLAPSAVDSIETSAHEIAFVRRALAASSECLEQAKQIRDTDNCGFWSLALPLLSAAYHAGWLQASECVPQLRQMEAIEVVGTTSVGPVDWASLETLVFRQVAKLSLLRLGQHPQWQAHYRFRTSRDDGSSEREPFPFPMELQIRDPAALERGLNQKECLMRLGAPDFIQRECWEYDFSPDQGGFTACVHWDDKQFVERSSPTIARVEIVGPQWKQLTMRDQDIVCC